jgi:hypothetical protein
MFLLLFAVIGEGGTPRLRDGQIGGRFDRGWRDRREPYHRSVLRATGRVHASAPGVFETSGASAPRPLCIALTALARFVEWAEQAAACAQMPGAGLRLLVDRQAEPWAKLQSGETAIGE